MKLSEDGNYYPLAYTQRLKRLIKNDKPLINFTLVEWVDEDEEVKWGLINEGTHNIGMVFAMDKINFNKGLTRLF